MRRSWSIQAKKTAQLCWNCTLCVERNSLVLKLFQKILKIMIFLQPLIQNFWQGCKSCLLRVERNKTDVFFRTWLLIPEVFFGTWAGVFDLCSEKKNAKVRWNCTLPPERNSPMLKHFMSNSKVILFSSRWDKSFDSFKKLHSTCTDEQYGVKRTFWNVL